MPVRGRAFRRAIGPVRASRVMKAPLKPLPVDIASRVAQRHPLANAKATLCNRRAQRQMSSRLLPMTASGQERISHLGAGQVIDKALHQLTCQDTTLWP
jgi:hypothetical protein